MTHRFVGWAKDQPVGTEFADVRISTSWLRARGVAVGTEPAPYRVDYELTTGAEFVTTELALTVTGSDWWRRLRLTRSPAGQWAANAEHDGNTDLPPPGGDTAGLTAALDVDVEQSPVFNTMPVLRHGLHDAGDSVEFQMVWVSLPDLRLHPSAQRYSHLGKGVDGRVVSFESLDADFTAEVVFDEDGLVVDYPGVGRRILTDAERRVDE